MSVSIRLAGPSDADALAALAALTFPLATTPATQTEEIEAHVARELSVDRFRGFLDDPTHDVLVGDSAGALVGYVMLVHGEPEDPSVLAVISSRPTTELSKFYVHPDHHGTGVAADLMRVAIGTASAAGARSVWLGVSDENERANRFYGKHGFVIVGAKRFRIGARFEDDHIRERRLEPGPPPVV